MLWENGRPSVAQCRRIQRSHERAGDRKLRQTFSWLLRCNFRCSLPIAAGNDFVMVCNCVPEIENVHRIMGALQREQIDRALENISRFKKILVTPNTFSEGAFRKVDSEIWDLRVAVLGEEGAKQRSPE